VVYVSFEESPQSTYRPDPVGDREMLNVSPELVVVTSNSKNPGSIGPVGRRFMTRRIKRLLMSDPQRPNHKPF